MSGRGFKVWSPFLLLVNFILLAAGRLMDPAAIGIDHGANSFSRGGQRWESTLCISWHPDGSQHGSGTLPPASRIEAAMSHQELPKWVSPS